MATIKATCPTCGDVDLKPKDITVLVAPAAGWATYAFTCPTCTDEVSKQADDEVVTLLRGAGVRVDKMHIPAEALELHYGDAINYDDLIDFGVKLSDTDDLISVLMSETR